MISRNSFFVFLIFGIVLLAACDKNRVYDSYVRIPSDGWQKDSLFRFSFDIENSIKNYNLYFNLRNSVDYQYSNIWFFVTLTSPDLKSVTDTIEFVVADRSGKWLGEGHGKLRDNRFLYRSNVYFPVKGTYEVDIRQGMRNDLLTGISDVGVRVEKVN